MNIKNSQTAPAASLMGLTLPNGWVVVESIVRDDGLTGGMFSHHYIVQRGGTERAFLKAFDFSNAFQPGVDTIKFLSAYTTAFEHEREILLHCKDKRLSRIVLAIDHGQVQVPGFAGMNGQVFYLIFALADGDIRQQVDQTKKFDVLWSLRAIKDVCLALFQVHKQQIAHQDTKPSNVLIFREDGFRLADFGRSSRKGKNVWYDEHDVAGDRNYAPPELLYGFCHPDFAARRMGCDLYMLGSLSAFMFTGVNMTAALFAALDKQFHWQQWHGSYADVLPQVQEAFARVLDEVRGHMPPEIREDVTQIVAELCNPDLSRRGHPRGLGGYNQYSLERYVSKFDVIYKKVELSDRLKKISA